MKRFLCTVLAFLMVLVIFPSGTVSATVQNRRLYSFQTVDGETVSTYSNSYDVTVSIFSQPGCNNTYNLIQSIIDNPSALKNRVQILYIDAAKNTKQRITELKNSFGTSVVKFCYDTSNTAYTALWDYARAAGFGNSITLPIIVFTRSDGTVFKTIQGDMHPDYFFSLANGDISQDVNVNLSISGDENYSYANEVLKKLNDLRKSLNLPLLTMDQNLLSAAMQRAAEISVYYSHTRPNGTSCFTALSGSGNYAENIAIGQVSPSNVMYDWTNSSGHYANMTEAKYQSVGIGCFTSSNGYLCWVQMFSSSAPTEVTKTGIQSVTRSVVANAAHLSLSVYADKNPHELKKGEGTQLRIENTNKGFNRVVQKLTVSDFNFKTNNNVVSVDQNGYCTANGTGDVTVTVEHKQSEFVKAVGLYTIGHTYSNACDKSCNVCSAVRTVGAHNYTNNADTSCNYCGAYAYPGGNTLVKENGVWYHVVNRKKVSDTTLVKYSGVWYYVENGRVDFTQNGLFYYGGKWYHLVNGKVVFDTTLVLHGDGNWYYVENGAVDFTQSGLFNYSGKWWHLVNGKVIFDTTLVLHTDKNWYYVEGGAVDFTQNGLFYYGGKYYHLVKGKVVFDTTLVLHTDKNWYYVENGAVDFTQSGLFYYSGKWWHLVKGKVIFDTTLVLHGDGNWYYVEGGAVDFTQSGLFYYSGKYYHLVGGKVVFDTTLVLHTDKNWYYVEKGAVDFTQSGLYYYSGKWWHLVKGKVIFDTTLVQHGDGKWYYVENGAVDFTQNGKVLYVGKYYTVKNGVVV